MDEREMIEAYRATDTPLELMARQAAEELAAAGGSGALTPCAGGCGALMLWRPYCRVCLELERAKRRAPGGPGALGAAAGR